MTRLQDGQEMNKTKNPITLLAMAFILATACDRTRANKEPFAEQFAKDTFGMKNPVASCDRYSLECTVFEAGQPETVQGIHCTYDGHCNWPWSETGHKPDILRIREE